MQAEMQSWKISGFRLIWRLLWHQHQPIIAPGGIAQGSSSNTQKTKKKKKTKKKQLSRPALAERTCSVLDLWHQRPITGQFLPLIIGERTSNRQRFQEGA